MRIRSRRALAICCNSGEAGSPNRVEAGLAGTKAVERAEDGERITKAEAERMVAEAFGHVSHGETLEGVRRRKPWGAEATPGLLVAPAAARPGPAGFPGFFGGKRRTRGTPEIAAAVGRW